MNAMLIGTCLLACIWLSWYITRRFVLFAMEQQLVDVPNGRSSHRYVTPRGGGVSFVCVMLGATIALFLLNRIPWMPTLALLSGFAVALVGFLDDRSELPILTRLFVHLSSSAVAIFCLLAIPATTHIFPAILLWIGVGIAILGFTWLINLFNFMDGIDGLAASESACIAAVCCIMTVFHRGFHEVSLLFGVLAVASIGFLIWNWHPAQIFMGDAGSGFLGYSLGALSLMAIGSHDISPWSPLILTGVFAIDATTTLLRRMIRRERWYKPHRLHAFQHAAQIFGHRNVTLTVIGINLLWLTPWAVLADLHPNLGGLFLLVAWAPVAVLAYLFHAGEVLVEGAIPRWRTAILIASWKNHDWSGRARTKLRSFVKENMPACRSLLLLLMSLGCAYLALLSDRSAMHRAITRDQILLAGVLSIGQFLSLLAFGLHRCHWHLISIEELPNIVGMSLAATLFGAVGAIGITRSALENTPGSGLVLDALLIVVAIILGHILAAAVSRDGHLDQKEERVKRVVIYGADTAGVGISSDLRRLGPSYRLVGFVDARKSMTGIHLGGGRVLGADEEIRRLVDTYKVDHVLISSTSLSTQPGQMFLRQCRQESIDYRIIPSIQSGIESRAAARRQPSSVTP